MLDRSMIERPVRILLCDDGSAFIYALDDYLRNCGYDVISRRMKPDEINNCCEELSPDILIQCIKRADAKLHACIRQLRKLVPGMKIFILSYMAAPRVLSRLTKSGAELPLILPATLSTLHRRIAMIHCTTRPDETIRHLLIDHIIQNQVYSSNRSFSYFYTAACLRLRYPIETQKMEWLYKKVGELFGVPHHRAERILRHYINNVTHYIRKGIFADISDPGLLELLNTAADTFTLKYGLYTEPPSNRI